MKTIILCFSGLIFSLNLFSQPVVAATKQDWYSGVCCNWGTNYTISLTWNTHVIGEADITSVCLNGITFQKEQLHLSIAHTGNSTTVYIQIATNYSGCDVAKFIPVENEKVWPNQINYTIGNFKNTVFIPELVELFPIDYP
ncbi:MAG TPA: hypothetical protein VK177_08225 [Flavobacteriales bacterium]|nr:hypothetical protein [Flavobacteriales bacterium]